MDRQEFQKRFKAEIIRLGGETFTDIHVEPYPTADYADVVVDSYFDHEPWRAEGPEACAEIDFKSWRRSGADLLPLFDRAYRLLTMYVQAAGEVDEADEAFLAEMWFALQTRKVT